MTKPNIKILDIKLFIITIFITLFIGSEIVNADEIKLTQKQSEIIAYKIWQNEGAGLRKYLIHWNKGEEFASVGIGHFIWFTKDQPMWFFEAFPALLEYISLRGTTLPSWLNTNTSCPWNSRKELMHAKKVKSKKYQQLENFLVKTMGLQAEFMAYRLNQALPKILKYAENTKDRKLIYKNFNNILYNKKGNISTKGAYILVDYVNFKGDGTIETERYQGKGWGLFQVLKNMNPKDTNPYRAFAKSAQMILDRLIMVSPAKRNLKRFRAGWFKRLETYYK